MNLGKIDEDGHAGPACADGLLEAAELAVDARQVANDLGEPHDGHLLGADDALEARRGHALAAHAEETCRLGGDGKARFECRDYQRAVVLAAGLACRDEDALAHVFLIVLVNIIASSAPAVLPNCLHDSLAKPVAFSDQKQGFLA